MIAGRPEDLPDFRKPPLAETVLSLQFEPIQGLTTAHLGLLWSRFREQFPLVEEHPPLLPVLETFGPPSHPHVEVTLEERLPVPRIWFLNSRKTELVQVQADRLIHNWREVDGVDPYPRYEPIRERFRSEVASFEEFLAGEGLIALAINQCEVTYVNHIEPSGIWTRHAELGRVMANWSDTSTAMFLPEMEDAWLRLRYSIPGPAGEPIGRLHVTCQPGWKKTDGSPLLVLTLTARGRPLGRGTDDAFGFFDLGREWIVRAFADLTSPDMHRAWERIDGYRQ